MKQSPTGLSVQGITVRLRGRDVLRQIDLALEPGKLTVLLGANGAGKTTLIRVLAGVRVPGEGKVVFFGENLEKIPPAERARKISYLPQSLLAPFSFTVNELLNLNTVNKKTLGEVVDVLELQSYLGRSLTTLSGGEKQRAAVARALAGDAATLLLDEPTAHLDLRHTLRLLHYLKRRADEGAAILLATHDLVAVLPFAGHVVLLSGGQVAYDGPAQNLPASKLEQCLGIESELLPEGAFPQYLNLP